MPYGIILLCLLLSGCEYIFGESGYVHNRSNAYLASSDGEKLKLPPGLSAKRISNYYVIPNVKGVAPISMVPPNSMSARIGLANRVSALRPAIHATQYKFIDEGKRVVLVMNMAFDDAWPTVASGLHRQRIKVVERNLDHKEITILDTYSTFDKITPQTPIYQMKINPDGKHTRVFITTMENKTLNPATSQRILAALTKGMQGKSNVSLMRWVGEKL